MSRTTRGLTAETIAHLLVDTDPYLSCDDCFERLDEYVERIAVDPRDTDPLMSTHLAGCGACAEEAAALHELLAQQEE